jgi:hypothetical protein
MLRPARHQQLLVTVSFTPSGRRATTVTQVVTLRH